MATCREEKAKGFRNSLKAHMKDTYEGNNQRCRLSWLKIGAWGLGLSTNKTETTSPRIHLPMCVWETERDMLGGGMLVIRKMEVK